MKTAIIAQMMASLNTCGNSKVKSNFFKRLYEAVQTGDDSFTIPIDELCENEKINSCLQEIASMHFEYNDKGADVKQMMFSQVKMFSDKITFDISSDARKIFFNPLNEVPSDWIEELFYLKRKSSCILYCLFVIMLNVSNRETVVISLRDLKKCLGYEESTSYKEYRYFNIQVLKVCHKEITEKTSLRFTYEGIRIKDVTEMIKFTLE